MRVCYTDEIWCDENSVRLNAGGQSPPGQGTMGRVEVCVGGAYGTVSSKGFGQREAAAVCKQLGFQGEGKQL